MTKNLLTIDGSRGEGGGQILRSAMALAIVTGRSLRIEKIRAGRAKPGLQRQHLTAVVSNLPTHIGEREIKHAAQKLNWRSDQTVVREVPSNGPGNILLAEVACRHVTEVFSAVGRQGVSAERVAAELVRDVRRWEKSGTPVGEYLADQLLLPLGLSAAQPTGCGVRRGGVFRTGPLSRHSMTHIELLQVFLNVSICVENSATGTLCVVSPS